MKRSFQTSVRVIYGDTDSGGVVYNANYLRYFEIGRTELMRTEICSYKDIEDLGYILPVSECFSRFKAPARYDDLITIETSIAEVKRFSVRFDYRILKAASEPEKKASLLVKGYTVHACITTAGKLTPLPETLATRLAELAEEQEEE